MDLIERPAGVLDEIRRHPWELARARLLLRLVEGLGVAGTERWLDVGAGDAWLARQLRQLVPADGDFVCWDVSYSPDDLASISLLDPSLSLTAERPQGRFGGILMLDVIEHVDDDAGFVGDTVRESLAPGGWVLVTVPAHQALFSDHDRALRHYRRYSRRSLRSVLEGAGLDICVAGTLFHSLLPVRAVQVVRERVGRSGTAHGVGAWEGGARITALLTQGFELEGRMSLWMAQRHLLTPPGLTNWAFCRRRQGSQP